MKSQLLATRLGHQNPDFLDSLRVDNWLGSRFASSFSAAAPAPQSAAGPLVESIATPGPQQLAFTAGNIVVYRVGDGSAALSNIATAVFLDEYTTAGGPRVQMIAMPVTDSGANQILAASGSATSEGLLTRSTDGHYLILTGYDSAPGTVGNVVSTSTSGGTAVLRVIGRVDSSGNVDTSTTTTSFSTGNIRGAASNDGTAFWATGSNTGVVYTTLGGSGPGTIVSSASATVNLRSVEIYGGQLYVSTGSGSTFRIGQVGSNMPTTTGQNITNIPGGPTTGSSYQFFFADLTASVSGVDTLYVADDTANQLQKYTFNGTTWAADGTITITGVRGLIGSVSGSNVSLYATSSSTIFSFTDTSGYDGTISGSATAIVTAAANTAFRGIAFAPTPVAGAETQTVQFNPTSVTHDEGDSGTTVYTFTVTRTGGTTGQLDFSGTIAAGSTDNADYVGGTAPTTFNGSILAGQTSATVTVNIQGDVTVESSESFTLTLTNVTNVAAGVNEVIGANATGTGNITNDDLPGSFSVDDVTHLEGNSGNTAFTFTITRTGGTDGAVDVSYTVAAPGGAGFADSADFAGGTLFAGTASFIDGQTTQTITLNVVGDIVVESTETFTVTLTGATGGGTIGDGSGTGTITNDDSPPVISIADASTAEGNNGVTYLVLTVSLDHATGSDVTVDFDTTNGSALAGSDYVDHDGQLTIAAGQTSATISVPLIGDTNPENNETFTVTLSNPAGASIGDGSATGTITNDDGSGYYSLAGGSFTQNWTNTGQITANDDWSGVPFIIGYLGDIDPAGSTTNVDPRTLTGAALGAIDVIAQTVTTNASGGVGEFEITNPVVGLQGSGTADAPSLVLYMDSSGRSDIRLQANLRDIDSGAEDAAQQVNVQYRTSPGGTWTNVPGAYFSDVTTAGTATQVTVLDVILPAGANNAATLEIRIMTTNAAGSDEWVGIDDIMVSSAVSGPSLSIANAAVFEGDSGPTIITFTVTRSGTSTGEVTADYELIFGSGPFAAGTDDFTALSPLSGQVSFADGQTTATITASIDGDVGPEGDENFTVLLSNPSAGATIADGTATGTIVNDDGAPPLVTINDVTVTEGDAGTSLMTFTVTRTGGTGAFDVDWETADGTATEPSDYAANSGTIHFAAGQMTDTVTVAVTINGDTQSEPNETLTVTLSNATNFALITDAVGIGTIAGDDPIYIHDIQGTAYYSPILAAEGVSGFNIASAGSILVSAIVTAVDNDGPRQGYYLTEEITDWDGNSYTSEGIFVMTRNDAGVGAVVSGVSVGDLVELSAQVMEYQVFSTMPRTILVNPTGLQVISSGNSLPTLTLTNMPNEVMTGVTPDYTDSADGVGDTFDASVYALSYFETVEGMLVTIPNMVVADGFVSTSGGDPFLQAYSLDSANADQINSRGGYTIAGDPPIGPPDTATTGDDTNHGGRHLHDGDVNPDIIEVDFTGFAMSPPSGLTTTATMGDLLGDLTGIIDFDFTDRKLFVTAMEPGGFVNGGIPTQEVTVLGDDTRSLTVATFNVQNLDPGDGAARFTALANAIANNLNAPDIISIEEMQDNNGATASGGADASTTWQMLVDALNLATGAHYQWVDQEPNAGTEGGEPGGNIRVGFLYNTDRVQLGDLDANATLAERRTYTDRIGDGVRDAGDLIAFSDNMLGGEINTPDWSGTRRSLLGEFTFHGNTVYVTANHFPAKGGSGEFWQVNQNLETGDPDNSGWSQRNQVAQDVYSMMNLIQSTDADAGIVAGGDFNDFYFYRPLTTVTGYTMADGTARAGGARFDNLTLTLAEAERYTYTFDGRSQAIDHVIANSLLSGVATYDVVHINTGYNGLGVDPALSDHDPALSSFDFRSLSELLIGTAGADSISGFGGNDRLLGGAGVDILRGGEGNDFISGGTGTDGMYGGTGNDVFYVDQASDYLVEASGEGTDVAYASVSYGLVAGVEVEILSTAQNSGTGAIDLYGNEFDNIIYGNAGANFLSGDGGNDVLVGLGGADLLSGDDGNDTLDGGAGNNILLGGAGVDILLGGDNEDALDGGTGADGLYGGDGNDSYHVDQAGDYVLEAANRGTDIVYASASYALAAGSSVEILSTTQNSGTGAIDLSGNELDNIIYGNAGINGLRGGGGNDLLIGLGGNDVYYITDNRERAIETSGGGTDLVYTSVSYALEAGSHIEILSTTQNSGTGAIDLTGNEFVNILYGNNGANVLNGGNGNDALVGAGGADTFAFTTALGANNVDQIADFVSGTDKIALDDAVFTGLGLGSLPANAFVTGSAAGDADDRIIYDSANGNLYYDADGTGAIAAVLFANLQGHPILTASDFQVI